MSELADVETIGVCGAGAMGAGIAQVAAQAGHNVIVYDLADDALEKGRALVERGAQALLKRKKLDAQQAGDLLQRLRWTRSIADLADCGLVIEAIVENAEAKKRLFEQIEACTAAATIVASNTSSLSISSLACGLARPANFIGLHFFNPAPIMKLVEVVPGTQSDARVVSFATSLVQRWGKHAVVASDVPGFIVNRVARPFYGEGWRAYQEGVAPPEAIDFLFRDLAGFRMGPLELGDLIGHDVNSTVAVSIFESYFGRTRFVPSSAQMRLVESGLLGRKTGQGVYDHSGAGVPAVVFSPSQGGDKRVVTGPGNEAFSGLLCAESVDESLPAGFWSVDGVLVGFSNGMSAVAMSRETGADVAIMDWVAKPLESSALAFSQSSERAGEAAAWLLNAFGKNAVRIDDRPGAIVFRTLLQLVNAASDGLRDRIADEQAIDIAMRFGVNHPFGPMAWARQFGLSAVVDALENVARETGEPDLYQPNQTLRRLAWADERVERGQ